MQLENWTLDRFIEYASNPRENDHAVDKTAAAIHEFGFRVPIVAKSDGLIVDGHLRLKAAKKLKLETVPVLLADDMSDAQIKAFRVSVNKIADLADWNEGLLSLEIEQLKELDFDIELLGFDEDELDSILGLIDEEEVEFEDEKEIKDEEKYLLLIEYDNERQLEKYFNETQERGFKCKIIE